MNSQIIEGITYILLPSEKIKEYVVDVCEKEWDSEDFPKYGDDLYKSIWRLEEVEVDKILPNNVFLQSKIFQTDVQPRLKNQRGLYSNKTPIPPLILRRTDLLIFDGYARYLLLKELGVKKCLAYVGYRD